MLWVMLRVMLWVTPLVMSTRQLRCMHVGCTKGLAHHYAYLCIMKCASKSLAVHVQTYDYNFMFTQVFLMSDEIRTWSDICQNTTNSYNCHCMSPYASQSPPYASQSPPMPPKVPPCLPMSPYASPCPPMPPHVALCLPMSPYASPCPPMPPHVPLCLPMSPYASPCPPMPPHVPLCLPMSPHDHYSPRPIQHMYIC